MSSIPPQLTPARPPRKRRSAAAKRRRKLLLRVGPIVLGVLAVVSFGVGMVIASGSPEVDAAERFAQAWSTRDYEAMYAELTPEAQAETSLEEFEDVYKEARESSTLQTITVGEARGPIDDGGTEVVAVDIDAVTESFGAIGGELPVPVADGAVSWAPNLVFPGLEPDETLDSTTKPPKRAPILATDGSALAEGPADARTTNGAGGIVAGSVGALEGDDPRAEELVADGFPEDMAVGTSGLELAFDEQLRGTPGGRLFAVSDAEGDNRRLLAQSKPTQGEPLRTTIDPGVQQAAADALGAENGGVAVLDAKSGAVRALAGLAFSALQPPGSTMKIITAAAALENGDAEPGTEYPVEVSAVVDGREIDNAHDELCGGDLVESFAESCNSVFAPLGVEVGRDEFIEASEKFGFNEAPTLYGKDALKLTEPPTSVVPPDSITNDVELAVSAIGQGLVQATPLQMASVAQTIANGGVRSPTSIVKDPALAADSGDVTAVSEDTAAKMSEMMVEVVESGTGQAAQIDGVEVAGKTGTAELGPDPNAEPPDPDNPDAEPELLVDAWFSAFAPADNPKLAVAVMIVEADGDGGVIAAPIAQQILASSLG